MEQRPSYADERLTAFCLYCGASPDSREHVPSRVLLDEPYPENLPVVAACSACNRAYALDEEYLACLIECALRGTTNPSELLRPKVARLLRQKPALAARISAARDTSTDQVLWQIENTRVIRIVEKLARGHALFELSEAWLHDDPVVSFTPLHLLNADVRKAFESPVSSDVWPEVGSRAFIAAAEGGAAAFHDWIDVQEDRYRYLAGLDRSAVVVRMVFSEYLAAEVVWI